MQDEGNWRLAKADRFLAAARRALDAADAETAISRAYYAAYHSVLAMLEAKTDATIPRRHATLHNLLASRRDEQLLTESSRRSFRDLFAAREVADYEERLLNRNDALVWVEAARAISAEARKVISDG